MTTLKTIADSLRTWRTEYLAKVGVPTVWPESWDFVAAVTACESSRWVSCESRGLMIANG